MAHIGTGEVGEWCIGDFSLARVGASAADAADSDDEQCGTYAYTPRATPKRVGGGAGGGVEASVEASVGGDGRRYQRSGAHDIYGLAVILTELMCPVSTMTERAREVIEVLKRGQYQG